MPKNRKMFFATVFFGFLTIILLMTLNEKVFASATVKYNLEDLVDKCGYLTENAKERIKNSDYFKSALEDNIKYDYLIVKIWDGNPYGFFGLYFTNSEKLNAELSSYGAHDNSEIICEKGYIWSISGSERNNGKRFNMNNSTIEFFYTESEIREIGNKYTEKFNLPNPIPAGTYQNNGNKNFKIEDVAYLEGYEPEKKPFFEFSANRIGTTKIGNFGENINCYYMDSFKSWANSYMAGKEIGKLYIDSKYIMTDLYYGNYTITKYNLNQTQSWQIQSRDFFTDKTETNGYINYTINIESDFIQAPYIYNIYIQSTNKELAEDININFAILTKDTTGNLTVESGDTQVSGDFTKDETTLGDIQSTIKDIFKEPNEEELKKEQEQNINDIQKQLQDSLGENQIFKALEVAENGFIEILRGKPRGF